MYLRTMLLADSFHVMLVVPQPDFLTHSHSATFSIMLKIWAIPMFGQAWNMIL